MKYSRGFRLACLVILLGIDIPCALATVSVSKATGGSAISADTAATAPSPAWTSLGTLTFTEGTRSDFTNLPSQTLVIKTPSGFEFNPAAPPSISCTAGRNLANLALSVSDPTTS